MLSRSVFYIMASIACLIVPLIGVLYGIWDSYQPKVGPVGNGHTAPTLVQIIPMITTFIVGAINLPKAIIQYRKRTRAAGKKDGLE